MARNNISNYILTGRRLRLGFCLLIFAVALLTSCSTTSGIPDGEQLYTGMKPTKYVDYQDNKHFRTTQEELDVILATKPNAALLGSPSISSPFPVGLWIWNAFNPKNTKFSRWMVKAFGSQPVLMSYANPALHESVGEATLAKRGYFHGNITYKLLPQKNPKKMKMQYTVDMGPLWRYDSIQYVNFPDEADSLIVADSANAIIHNGDAFDISGLENERKRIANLFRNNGYYYYNKDKAAYMADTISSPGNVLLKLQMADSLQSNVMRKWYIGNITVNFRKQILEELNVHRNFRHYSLNYNGKKSPLRFGVILSDLQLRHGDLYNASKDQLSQQKVNSLGLFSSSRFSFTPRDSTDDCDTLDMNVDLTFDKPYDFYIEAYGKGKTSGKYGPEVIVGMTKRNAFRAGELLNVRLHGSYEWQTGHRNEGSSSKINSYEYGAEASLDFPRIVNPFRVPIRKRIERMRRNEEKAKAEGKEYKRPRPRRPRQFYETPMTTLKASFDVVNRADFFKRHVVSGELTYDWKPKATSEFSLSPLVLTYEYMQSRTQRFIELEDSMPYLKTSMADQLIPKAQFSYTYTSPATYRNPIKWWTTVSESANLISLGYMCFGDKWGEKNKTMFKNPYAQFFKVETNFTKLWQLSEKTSIAAHVNAGVIYSYGNSRVAPYSEQFYVGGANSIRAFNVRSIGPGKYRSADRNFSYVEQTGDIKFLANLEFRPHILGSLYGAVFLDAGNVWTIHEDNPEDGLVREGGKFELKNLFNQMALGTGVGLRYDLGYFILRLDWGIGLHVPYADSHGFYNVDSFKDAQTLNFAIGLPF